MLLNREGAATKKFVGLKKRDPRSTFWNLHWAPRIQAAEYVRGKRTGDATHEEIGRVTRAIRDAFSQRGHLGQNVPMDQYIPLQ